MVLMNRIAEREDLWDYYVPQEDEYGYTPEPMQWFAVEPRFDYEAKKLEKAGIIFYYEPLGIWILPVTHYGTAWDYVPAPEIN